MMKCFSRHCQLNFLLYQLSLVNDSEIFIKNTEPGSHFNTAYYLFNYNSLSRWRFHADNALDSERR